MSTTDRYCVIGHPIAHSKSPVIHKLFARQTGEDIAYEAVDVPVDELADKLKELADEGVRGFNVTLPHKHDMARLVDTLSDPARLAGAVNTVTFADNGDIQGDNTDGIGLLADLKGNLKISLAGSRILILGAGGATRGIIPPLLNERPQELVVANRTDWKAVNLSEHFDAMGNIVGCSFDDLAEKDAFDLVINATSAGLDGEVPPFPSSIIADKTICYDLSYAMRETPFVTWARQNGCQNAYEGWGMLVEQAAESFRIWRGVRPDTHAVLRALR